MMRTLPFVICTLLASPLAAQQHLVVIGHNDYDGFGMSLAALDDLDGDGLADFAVGAYCTDQFGNVNGGSVTAFSSQDGHQLWMTNGDSGDERLGHTMTQLDDVNGDGYIDLVVGAYRDRLGGMRSGSVHVLSGLDGHRIYTIVGGEVGAEFGKSVDRVGDLDGDGIADWAAGAWLSSQAGLEAGAVYLHSGVDGALLGSAYGQSGSHFGHSVAGLGDIDMDGIGDVAVGAPNGVTGNKKTGTAEVLSGATQVSLMRLNGTDLSSFGFSVSGGGDIDGDQIPDLLVGAPESNLLVANGGAAYVYSGRNGSMLYQYSGADRDEGLGWSVNEVGDVDADDACDFLIGSPHHPLRGAKTGMLRLYSGKTGTLLRSWLGPSDNDKLGSVAIRMPDLNADNVDDWLIGAPEAGWTPQFEPGAAAIYLTEQRPALRIVALPAGGQGRVRVADVTPKHAIRLYASLLGYGTSIISPKAYLDIREVHLNATKTATGNKRVSFDFAVPKSASGTTIYFQAIDWTNSPKLTSNVGVGVIQ